MEMVQHAFSWVEIPVEDFERAKKFYSKIFDYEMPEANLGKTLMGILLSQTDGVGGAIVKSDGHKPSQNGTIVYLNGGKDLNIVLKRVESAGGKIIQQKTIITPDIGYFALFIDSEGNKVGLYSTN